MCLCFPALRYIGNTFLRIHQSVPNLTYTYRNLTLESVEAFPLSQWDACVLDLSKGHLVSWTQLQRPIASHNIWFPRVIIHSALRT